MRNFLLHGSLSLLCIPFLHGESAQSVFTSIYEKNYWGNKESVSGPGSTLHETQIIRKEIPKLLQSLNIQTMLDAPCGDFNWLKQIDLSFLEKYTGIDIVEQIIYKNKKQFGKDNKSFLLSNIIVDSLPAADLVLCRDCLVHFPFQEIWQTLANFKKSGIRYVLTTTFPGCSENKDILAVGGWRPLNLELPPFNFPEPLALITEEIKYTNAVYITKSLGLWELKDLK